MSVPNRLPGVPIYMPNRSINNWLNPAAFFGTRFGHLGQCRKKLCLRSLAVARRLRRREDLHITERNQLIFRTEAFDLFNRAQYGQPGSGLKVGSAGQIVPTSGFGRITSTVNPTGLVGTGTPRELELALRLTY
jgi:hypothetical protein